MIIERDYKDKKEDDSWIEGYNRWRKSLWKKREDNGMVDPE
jgi:iron uptake system EfeUOB component EfeO/EfeM